MDFIKEYFSWNFNRTAEGYLSWQHLTAVSLAIALAFILAIRFGRKFKNSDRKTKLKVIVVAALMIDGFELLKFVVDSIVAQSLRVLLGYLPLFLCSIPLIMLPIAAFAKGRIQQAALDFVCIFGLLGGLLGTFMAGNIYSIFPVIHFQPLVSLVTHSISAFASLYIGLSRLATLEKRNIGISVGILGIFMATAYVVNQIGKIAHFQDNYMFLSRSDGTPFILLENWFGSGTIAYSLAVALCMWAYLGIFYTVARLIKRKKIAPSAA